MKRLVKLGTLDMQKLENDYMHMIERVHEQSYQDNSSEQAKYKLKKNNPDKSVKTCLLNPLAVDRENALFNKPPYPGMQGIWQQSLRWIGK